MTARLRQGGLNKSKWRLASCFGALGSRLRHDRHGVQALEFALILPVLIGLLLAIVEISNIFFVRSEMSTAVREGARQAAVGGSTEEEVRKFVKTRVASVTKAPITVEILEQELAPQPGSEITVTASALLADVMITGIYGGDSSVEIEQQAPGAKPEKDVQSTGTKIRVSTIMQKEQ